MRQTPARIILLIIMFVLFTGQTQASFSLKVCDEQEQTLQDGISEQDADHEQEDEHCCDIDCCDTGCPCAQGLCSVALYLATSLSTINHLVSGDAFFSHKTKHPIPISRSFFRPPIYTSQA